MRSASALVLLALGGCVPPEPRGEPYGVYDVVGTLAAHECGQGAAPVDLPYARTFELRRDDTGLALLLGSDGTTMEGSVGSDGGFLFREQSWVRVIEPEEVLGVVGCDLVLTMTVEGSAKRLVDEETGEHTLEPLVGELVTHIAPRSGSDCGELLVGSESGGRFEALPCEVVLDLEGEPREEPSEETSGAQ